MGIANSELVKLGIAILTWANILNLGRNNKIISEICVNIRKDL